MNWKIAALAAAVCAVPYAAHANCGRGGTLKACIDSMTNSNFQNRHLKPFAGKTMFEYSEEVKTQIRAAFNHSGTKCKTKAISYKECTGTKVSTCTAGPAKKRFTFHKTSNRIDHLTGIGGPNANAPDCG